MTTAACGGSSGSSDNGAIKVGVVFSQTGELAGFGQGYLNATKLVFDKVNADGGINGHKIDYTVVDDASDPGTGVSVARKLISSDGIKLIYGTEYDPVSLAIANVTQSQGALFVSPAASSPDLTTPVKPLVFNVLPDADVQNGAIVPFLSSMHATRIGAIVETSGFGTQHNTALKSSLTGGAKVVSEETISPTATDASSQILAMQKAHVDAIVWEGASITAAVAIIQAANKYGEHAPIVTFGAGTSPATDQLLTRVPIEYYSVTPLACSLQDPCAKGFMSAYSAKYNDQPSVWTAQGYAAAESFVQALKNSSSYSPTDVAKALESTNFSTPLLPAPVKFTSTNHEGGNVMYLQGYKEKKLYFFGTDITDNKFTG
jgi:branched-chain amino acid transport system substrate-binding protein